MTNTFGPGRGVIWLDDVACSGTETTLSQCPHKGWNTADCGHNEDIAVKCGTSASSARLRTAPGIPTAAKLLNVIQESNCKYVDVLTFVSYN